MPLSTVSDFANWAKTLDDNDRSHRGHLEEAPDMEEAYPLIVAASAMVSSPSCPPCHLSFIFRPVQTDDDPICLAQGRLGAVAPFLF